MKEELRKLYLEEGLTIREISTVLGSSPSTIGRRLRSFGIERRNPGIAHFEKLDDKEWLHHLYLVEKLSAKSIGEKIGADQRTVVSWLEKHNIPRRPPGGQLKGTKMSIESRGKMSKAKKGKYFGSDNPNWKGNKVRPELRERRSHIARKWRGLVLERDDFNCQVCGSSDKLHVHHILPFKNYPQRRWDLNNGVTLCVLCHEKAHNRQFPDWLTGRVKEPNSKKDIVEVVEQKKFNVVKEELVELYMDMTIKQLSEYYGFSQETIRKKLKGYGVDRRSIGPKRIFMPGEDELKELYQKYSLKQIAQIFDVGETVVWKRVKEYGIELKGVGEGGHRKKKGKVFTKTHRENLSKVMKGLNRTGANNPNWKGGKPRNSN
jgi:transposase